MRQSLCALLLVFDMVIEENMYEFNKIKFAREFLFLKVGSSSVAVYSSSIGTRKHCLSSF